jgi:Holliday junction resolvasome RuvABC endonuclease subunit
MDTRKQGNEKLVLAIYPGTRGFGYALFEGPDEPVDWGLKEARGDKNERSQSKAAELIAQFRPDVLVLEDAGATGSRRSARIKELITKLGNDARGAKVAVREFSRRQIRSAFASRGAATRYEIAQAIARHFREFEAALPGRRKIWMSEDPKLAIFDAVSLVITFFDAEEQRELRPPATGDARS